MRGVQHRPVEGRVVTEHQRLQVHLPVECSLIHEVAEILLDRFVGDFSLTVGLGVVWCSFQVSGSQLLEQLLRQLGAELRSSVSDNV